MSQAATTTPLTPTLFLAAEAPVWELLFKPKDNPGLVRGSQVSVEFTLSNQNNPQTPTALAISPPLYDFGNVVQGAGGGSLLAPAAFRISAAYSAQDFIVQQLSFAGRFYPNKFSAALRTPGGGAAAPPYRIPAGGYVDVDVRFDTSQILAVSADAALVGSMQNASGVQSQSSARVTGEVISSSDPRTACNGHPCRVP
jgi:hypothetical protein